MTRAGPLAAGLDFARPQRSLQPAASPLGWTMLVLALLLCAWQVQGHLELTERRDAALVLAPRMPEKGRPDAALSSTQQAEIRFADETLRLGTVPWERIFQDIEAVAAPEISLLHVHPQGRSREIRIAGEARNFEALSAYLARLEQRPAFAGAQLLGHQLAEPQGSLKFEALVRWRLP